MRVVPIVAAALALVLGTAASAQAPASTASYSAERFMESGGVVLSGKVHHDHGKERWEVVQSGMQQVRIMRPDDGKLIMYMPQLNMGMEMPLEGGAQLDPVPNQTDAEPETVGREEVAGEATTKFRTEVGSDTGDPFVVFSWVTEDGIVMRTEGRGPRAGSSCTSGI